MMQHLKTSASNKAYKGFTLIELMIAVAIVGILAMISYPAYKGHTAKSHRIEAKTALAELASKQEIFFAQNSTYTTEVSANTGLGYGSTKSKHNDLYTLSARSCSATATDINRCYIVQAEATDAFQMKYDPDCIFMSIDSTGVSRASTDAAGTNDTTDDCW